MSYIGNSPDQQAFTPAVDFFDGTGSTTAFTLSRPVASVAQIQAVIENVPQKPGDAFTVNGNVITFTSAPPTGTQNIYVYYTSPITQVIAPSQGTVGTSQIADNSVTSVKINSLDSAKLTGDIVAARITSALNASGSAPIYACRAWVNFNGTGTVAIRASGNVSSITDNGTGIYTVNFTAAMPDTSYSASATSRRSAVDNADWTSQVRGGAGYSLTTTTVGVCTGNGSNGAFGDSDFVSVVIFR